MKLNKNTQTSDHAFWQDGAIWGISPDTPLNALSSIVQKRPSIKGFILLDFFAPDIEWKWIRETDMALSKFTYNAYHISLGDLEPMITTREGQPYVVTYEAYMRLSSELNAETWILFAKEIDSLSQFLLSKVLLDASDEYTLEGNLSSFHQEVTSYLLSERLHTLHSLIREISSLEVADSKVFQLEKAIIKARRDLSSNIKDLVLIINQTLETLKVVLPNRHEFADIEWALQLLIILCTKKGNQYRAIYSLAKYLSFDLIILGNRDHPLVQSFLQSIPPH